MSDIKTQADLEGMLNDPEAFNRYVTEKSLEVIGTSVKEQMDEAFKDGAVNRPPMSEEAVAEGTPMQGKQFGGGWQGGDDTKINLAKEAKAMGIKMAEGTKLKLDEFGKKDVEDRKRLINLNKID